MTSKKFPQLLAGFFNRGQRTRGGNNMPKCEERLHALLFSARFFALVAFFFVFMLAPLPGLALTIGWNIE